MAHLEAHYTEEQLRKEIRFDMSTLGQFITEFAKQMSNEVPADMMLGEQYYKRIRSEDLNDIITQVLDEFFSYTILAHTNVRGGKGLKGTVEQWLYVKRKFLEQGNKIFSPLLTTEALLYKKLSEEEQADVKDTIVELFLELTYFGEYHEMGGEEQ